MDFERYTVTLLVLRDDRPELGDADLDALQDAHLAHLADMHDAGHLLAAGPLLGPDDRRFRGLSIWRSTPEELRALIAENPDPAVVAGRFDELVLPWMVPAGALQFTQTRFPRSQADAQS